MAEYQGLINALQWLVVNEKQKEQVIIYMDSELVVKQVKGLYKVKHPVMKVKHQEAIGLLSQFSHVTFQNVPREKNAHPDRLVNEELDSR
jgi:ribonuclease HI